MHEGTLHRLFPSAKFDEPLRRYTAWKIGPPRVGESPVSFETRVHDIVPIHNCTLVLGEVVRVHVAREVWRDGRISPELLDPVLRLAGSMFAELGPTFNLRRPTYQDVLDGNLDRREREKG